MDYPELAQIDMDDLEILEHTRLKLLGRTPVFVHVGQECDYVSTRGTFTQ